MNLEERFWSKVDIKGIDECWNWNAGLFKTGYGSFKYQNESVGSNRMAWFLFYGEFPELWVLHKCDNRKCCNPEHLFLGTNQDNVDDRVRKGRTAKGENHGTHIHPENFPKGELHPQSKFKNEDIIEIKKLLSQGVSGKNIAKAYNVGKSIISYIKTNQRWNNITE